VSISIDSSRICQDLETLASFSEAPPPAVTRIVYTETDLRARAWLKEQCAAAGLDVREDAVGNTFARWKANDAGAPAVGTGSHIDAIPNSGKYDGTVGVLGGLEAIRALQRSGFKPQRSIELLLFTSEEPTRFGIGCLGSRLLSGSLDLRRAAELCDPGGHTLDDVRNKAGFAGPLESVRLPAGYYECFVELHIEQGPLLERSGVRIGVVTSIAAPASIRVLIQGEGGHAGGVLMHDRKDALLGAAEVALAVESAALSTAAVDTVATTGTCRVFPGAVNSIPSRVCLEIDARDTDLARRNSVVEKIEAACIEVGKRRTLQIETEVLNADPPAQCDRVIVDALGRVATSAVQNFRYIISRAYHDSLFMSHITRVGMLFIPCRSGVSHRPDEYASPDDIAAGVTVLAYALMELASS
jgi:ureidoglycolate amidohydrolase